MCRALLALAVVSLSGFGFEEKHTYESWTGKPKESFSSGRETFDQLKQTLLKGYVDGGLTEDDLYRAAAQGMLENLDPKLREWNRLLSPTERSELENDLAGELVGAGVEIKFQSESGIAEVVFVIPESPAASAGIESGDRIVTVDGKLFRGANFRDIVYAIRGKVGETRKLSLLRGDKLISKTVRLKKIPYAEVAASVVPGDLGLVSIRYFTGRTASRLKEALETLSAKKVKGLVVDLRGNEGGVLDGAIESAGLFVPKNSPIVRVSRRNQGEEVLTAKGEPVMEKLPIAVLINEQTSSGAEFLAAALKERREAVLVGKSSRGKWSVQTVEALGNKYAAKFTVGMMKSAAGNDYSGKGVPPDIEVSADAGEVAKLQRLPKVQDKLEKDSQLRTAVGLLKQRT